MNTKPKLSIGLPVYNGEATVGRAIETLLAQRAGDFELIVSDNASTDGTESVVRAHAAHDTRIRYIRQPRNLGALANFEYVLNQALADYFMWAAADDEWHRDFVGANLDHMDRHPDYVASISRVQIGHFDPDRVRTQGTFPLAADVDANLLAFVLHPDANSRFYGIHRTEVLRGAWARDIFWASDWALVCRVLQFGKYHEVPRVLMRRGHGGASRNMYRSIRAWNIGCRDTWFPMWSYSRFVLRYGVIRRSPRALAWLMWLNTNTTRKMLLGWMRERIAGR